MKPRVWTLAEVLWAKGVVSKGGSFDSYDAGCAVMTIEQLQKGLPLFDSMPPTPQHDPR